MIATSKTIAMLASVAALAGAAPQPAPSRPTLLANNNTKTDALASFVAIALHPPPPPPPPQPTAFNASGDWPSQSEIDSYANSFSCYCEWDTTPLYTNSGKIKTMKYWTQFWVYGRNWGDITEDLLYSVAKYKTKAIDYDSWVFQRIDYLHVFQSMWRSVAEKDFQPPDESTVPRLEERLTNLLASKGIDFPVRCLRKYPIHKAPKAGGVG